MEPSLAHDVALDDVRFDIVFPGNLSLVNALRHLGPTARLWAYRYLSHAKKTGSARELGYALHCLQDAVSHGVLGMAHIRNRMKMTERDPDDWQAAPVRMKNALERETKRFACQFLEARGLYR